MLKRSWFVTFLGLMAALSGCRDEGPREIVVQIHAEPVSLDPSLAEDGLSLRILANTMDGLVGYDENGSLQLLLADSYRVSPDGLRVEFTLRKGALWSDGVPVTPEDFVTAFRRATRPASGARFMPDALPIRNASRILRGKARPSSLGVRVEDGKLIFELERVAPYFVEALTLPVALPQRRDVLDVNGGVWPLKAPVTGAYRIDQRRTDRYYDLKPNPRHWNFGAFPRALPVRLQVVREEHTALNLFERGTVDIVTRVSALDQPRLRKEGVLKVEPFFATYYLGFNVRKAPFNRVEWRRAVSGAVRRAELTDALQTGDLPASSWIPKGLEGYESYKDPAPVFAADMEKVRALVRRRGSPDILAGFDSSERNKTVMEKVQRDLKEGLGLKVSLDSMDWKTYVGRLHAEASPIFRFGWQAPFADPIPHLQVFTSGNPANVTGWKNAKYDRLVQEIGSLRRGVDRLRRIERAQKLLLEEEAVVVPLYHYVQAHVVSSRIGRFKANPFGVVHFRRLKKD